MSFDELKLSEADIEIIDGDRGVNYPKQNEFYDIGYCLFLNAKNVTKDGFDFNEKSFISREKDNLLRKGKLVRNDIVLTTRGTVGNVAFYNNRVPFNNIRINSGMVILRAKQSEYLPEFVYWMFRSNYIQDQINALKTGSAQPQLPITIMRTIKVLKPKLCEQKAIAATLSVLDDMIELNNQINKTLEDMAQAIFKSWFVDFEPFKDGEFEDSELGLIPKGWRVGTIGSLCSNIFSGGTPLTSEPKYWNGIYPWLSSGETRRPIIIKTEKSITDEGIINSSTRLAKKYDIVIASAGQGHTRGQTAITLIDTYINQSVIALSSQAFGYLFCNLKNRYDELRAISDSSSIRGSLTTKILNRFPIILPPKEVLLEFQRIFEVIIEYCGQLAFQNEKLSEIRDTLLPKLMTGEIRVPVEEVI